MTKYHKNRLLISKNLYYRKIYKFNMFNISYPYNYFEHTNKRNNLEKKILFNYQPEFNTCNEKYLMHSFMFNEEKNLMKQIEKILDFADQLKKDGHKCVTIFNSCPPHVIWCRNKVCDYNYYH